MRYRLLPLAAAILLLAACSGETRSLPDRGGHAYDMGPGAGAAGAAQPQLESHPDVPRDDETYYSLQAGDRLYRVAQQHGVSLEWLIQRNDLVDHPVPAGTRLIVPRR